MKQEELKQYLAELKELTDIESPTASVEGVNSVAKWFMNKADKLGLKHEKVALGTDKSLTACSSQTTRTRRNLTCFSSRIWIRFFP